MIPSLPQLSFVALEDLVVHERHDDQRTPPLIRRIRASGVFRNPPVVSPLQDGSGRYMVLDGANRTMALQEMGYPHALVQVVQPDDPGLKLKTWNHVVWEMSHKRFLKNIQSLAGVDPVRVEDGEGEPELMSSCGLALVQLCNRQVYRLCSPRQELDVRVELLNAVVDTYRSRARLDRTYVRSVEPLAEVYPGLCALVMFPRFQVQDLMRLAGQGCLLPPGITRFTIAPRVLHLNYPLEELASPRSIESKNESLYRWIQERLARKGVRYYAEPTFLFDE